MLGYNLTPLPTIVGRTNFQDTLGNRTGEAQDQYHAQLNLVKSEMQHVYEENGRRYFAALGAIATISCGHCHHILNCQPETYDSEVVAHHFSVRPHVVALILVVKFSLAFSVLRSRTFCFRKFTQLNAAEASDYIVLCLSTELDTMIWANLPISKHWKMCCLNKTYMNLMTSGAMNQFRGVIGSNETSVFLLAIGDYYDDSTMMRYLERPEGVSRSPLPATTSIAKIGAGATAVIGHAQASIINALKRVFSIDSYGVSQWPH